MKESWEMSAFDNIVHIYSELFLLFLFLPLPHFEHFHFYIKNFLPHKNVFDIKLFPVQ